MSHTTSAAAGFAFTGERVIPGLVEPQLWNEHVSRYYFAQLFAAGARALDVGCGTGYGTNLLRVKDGRAVGFDVSTEAIEYARKNYPGAGFLLGSADAFPIQPNSFGLVTAFEVIEHIHRWPELIAEAARVITQDGVFLVSTPNKHYYAETREAVGPNPFHVHEFDLEELKSCLRSQFACVSILAQNQTEAIVFAGMDAEAESRAVVPPTQSLANAHFFLAVCSHQPVEIPHFTHVSNSGNLLRERDHYINLLKEDVRETHEQHLRLLDFHNELHRVLDERTAWATNLGASLRAAETELQEYTGTSNKARSVQADPRGGSSKADTELGASRQKVQQLETELLLVKQSKWFRAGRLLGIGPYAVRHFRPRAYIRARWRAAKAWLQPLPAAFLCKIQKCIQILQEWAIYLAAPLALLVTLSALAVHDVCFAIFGRRRLPPETAPSHKAATIIIPNWNGRDLLARFLPSVMASLLPHPGSEVLVVDNASTDDSIALLQSQFPQVRVLRMATNVGFAEAANAGAAASANEIVVMLNNDMRVEPQFLTDLLPVFKDPLIFAASSQIFFGDTKKRREETGLTEVWWEAGRLRVGHRIDPAVSEPFPCAYPGGGSSAFDRRKFLELGGFDTLFQPFYYEDTDLGRMAWTRGWKVLYVPTSAVHHEHRGTTGKHFSRDQIAGIVRRNSLLYGWKNLADWRLLLHNFGLCFCSVFGSGRQLRPDGLCAPEDARRAFRKLPQLLRSRWLAKTSRRLSDREAFHRPLGGYFRDRFLAAAEPLPARLNVLFAAPYPIEPPTHGGAVFMKEALTGLQKHADVHLVCFVDTESQLPEQETLQALCQSMFFMVRPHISLENQWTIIPNAIREFNNRDFAWAIHRTILLKRIDVVQLEYTVLGQYAGRYQQIPCMLFEHDVSVQSLWRRIRVSRLDGDLLLEYLRMRFYEPRLLKRFARIQVCTENNARALMRLSGATRGRVDADVRAGVDVSRYDFTTGGREPDTLLFIGSFRHSPNLDALRWFKSEVFPAILKERPATVLYVVGSGSEIAAEWISHPNIRLLGSVPDVKEPFQKYAVFLCPIQSGSGVRVKLLEAFSSGISSVSTTIGAEGLGAVSGDVCELADTPQEFAAAVLRLLADDGYRSDLAQRARSRIEECWDARVVSNRLAANYRREVNKRRFTSASG